MKCGRFRLKSLFLVQSSLSCIIQSQAEHGLEYGSSISIHAVRQAYQVRAQVYVKIYICMYASPVVYLFAKNEA